MTTTEPHWSYSQWEDFSGCGYRYKLKRSGDVTIVPSVAAVAGKAFHTWTEHYDFGDFGAEPYVHTWENCFADAVQHELDTSGVPIEQWRVGGRATKAAPDRENLPYWQIYGWELCETYTRWASRTPWTIAWDLPPDKDGRTTGIEYGIDVTLGGDPFRGFFDRLSRDEHGNLGIVDIKTGTQVRHSVQLGFYAAAARQHGLVLHWGALYLARKGETTEPVVLDRWDEPRVAAILAPQQFKRDSGIFEINPGGQCDWCPVRQACDYHF